MEQENFVVIEMTDESTRCVNPRHVVSVNMDHYPNSKQPYAIELKLVTGEGKRLTFDDKRKAEDVLQPLNVLGKRPW